MALTFRSDPGPCLVCGAAHTACTSDSGPIVASQLPARDALAAEAPEAPTAPDSAGEVEFTTATFRGSPKRRRSN